MTADGPSEHRPVLTPSGRLAGRLLSGHWLTFLVELLLIVIGILVALSIDGWVQDREDRRAERAYLNVLGSDFGQMVEQLQAYIALETANAEAGAAVLRRLSQDNYAQHGDELRVNLSDMGSRRTLRLVSAAYTDLTSTGNLRLIRNRELRDQMLRYFAVVERIQLVIEKNNTVFVDQLYFRFTLDQGITWMPDALFNLDPDLSEANRDMAEMLGEGIRLPVDEILTRPDSAESWERIRRLTLMRVRVATVGRALARSLIRGTENLKAAIEAEITGR